MIHRTRLERLAKEIRRRQPIDKPCVCVFKGDYKEFELQRKRHLESCKKACHFFIPAFSGSIIGKKT